MVFFLERIRYLVLAGLIVLPLLFHRRFFREVDPFRLLFNLDGPLFLLLILLTFLLLSLFVGEGHAALFAKGRVGEDVVHCLRWLHDEGVGRGNEAVSIDLTDVVEEEIHQAKATRAGDDLVAVEGLVAQERFLALVQLGAGARQPIVGTQEEAASAAQAMHNEADHLSQAISVFKLGDGTASPALPSSPGALSIGHQQARA